MRLLKKAQSDPAVSETFNLVKFLIFFTIIIVVLGIIANFMITKTSAPISPIA